MNRNIRTAYAENDEVTKKCLDNILANLEKTRLNNGFKTIL